MKFWKMNGAGNDFILLNNLEESLAVETLPQIAQTLCERHMSIGADGLMVVDHPEETGDIKMRFYNADGSLGEMCGNGARCICRYAYENGLAGESQTIETTAGIVTGQRLNRQLYKIRLNDPTTIRLNESVEVEGSAYPCSYVELGNPGLPHAVVPYAHLMDADEHTLRELGRKIRYHPHFAKGANVNFCEIIGADTVFERTFERGVEDFTYACGTGTGSVVAVLMLQGKVTGKGVRVGMTGGELIVDAERSGDTITALYLTGPTNIVAKGEVTDENLTL